MVADAPWISSKLDNDSNIYYVFIPYIQKYNFVMAKQKKRKSAREEDVKLVVRIEAELRDAFIEACQEQDTTASREVRRFIRDFLARLGKTDA